MSMTPRLLAPIATPPAPKPPQLNIVASSLMPDVATDTYGPGAGPVLAAAGWSTTMDAVEAEGQRTPRRMWNRPAGETAWRDRMEYRNALVAAIGKMDEIELKQIETDAGVTVDTLPESVFPATADSRWTGGFAYAPENQSRGVLADPCGQTIDLPGLPAPVLSGANGAGTLATASYDYTVTAVNANGQTLVSNTVVVAVTTGGAQLSWPAVPTAASYNIFGRTHSATRHFIANTSATSFLDDGTIAPGSGIEPTTNTTGGPGNYANLPQVGYVPFLIQVEDVCSTFGWEERDFVGRALRLLDNATPNAVEREFWTGAFATNTLTGPMFQSDGPALNAFLQQSGTPSAGGSALVPTDLTPASVPSITRGIQILEDYLANTGFGGQGMLHVAPETSPNLLGARRVGALLLTVMDNIINPGSGYPTTGATGPAGNGNQDPGAGNAWIYCTDLTSVRLDKPFITPRTLAEAVDRSNFGAPDTIRIRAQRSAAVTFDNSRLAACRVALAT